MANPTKEQVLILGASNNPERYSYKALKMLQEYGHQPHLVHPSLTQIEGLHVHPSIESFIAKSPAAKAIDTLTVYVNPNILSSQVGDLLQLAPKRVIMNPGTEDDVVTETLRKHGIEVVYGCTLVMLRTQQF